MSTVDPQRMLDTATSFFLAGERCAPALEFGPYGNHTVDAPRIVSYAFAVEIILKLLLRLDGINPDNEHELSKLFEKLPASRRERLTYSADCVDKIGRYFKDWRYAYEKDFLVGECSNPRRVFIECYEELRRSHPNLKSCFEENWGSFAPDWHWAWPELEIRQLEASLLRKRS